MTQVTCFKSSRFKSNSLTAECQLQCNSNPLTPVQTCAILTLASSANLFVQSRRINIKRADPCATILRQGFRAKGLFLYHSFVFAHRSARLILGSAFFMVTCVRRYRAPPYWYMPLPRYLQCKWSSIKLQQAPKCCVSKESPLNPALTRMGGVTSLQGTTWKCTPRCWSCWPRYALAQTPHCVHGSANLMGNYDAFYLSTYNLLNLLAAYWFLLIAFFNFYLNIK